MNEVFILCGGKGKRMGQATQLTPKPLIKVNNQPMISHIVRNFQNQGFTKFVFGTGYLSEAIEEHLNKEFNDLEFIVSNSGTEAGMFKRIWDAKQYFNGTFVVAYGDTFIDLNYQTLLEFHDKKKADLTLVTGEIQNPFGILSSNNSDEITSFVEKPTQQHYIGSFAVNRASIDKADDSWAQLPDGQGVIQFFQNHIENKTAFRYLHKGTQITFNTESELANAEKMIGKYHTIKES